MDQAKKLNESGRISALDVARGAAILGILLANIVAFHYPVLATELLQQAKVWAGTDLLIEQLTTAFVTGKFRGMLCILFGAGMYLQFQRRQLKSELWPGSYLRRMSLLFVIGCVHGIFIWFGDILALYALTAMIGFWIVNLSTQNLWRLVAGVGVFTLLCGCGLGAMMASGGTSGAMQELGPLTDIVKGEAPAFASGSYGVQLLYRAGFFITSLFNFIFLAPIMLGLFALGLILGREDFFRFPSRKPKLLRGLLAVGLGIGLPLNGVALFLRDAAQLGAYQMFVELSAGAVLAVGYLTLLVLLSHWRPGRMLSKPLENVGRIALTTYLSQSLICTTIFYSYGFKLFGKLTRTELLWVVAGVWLFNLIFAWLWLKRFSMGPIECLWRSWAERVPFDLRRRPEAAITVPPKVG